MHICSLALSALQLTSSFFGIFDRLNASPILKMENMQSAAGSQHNSIKKHVDQRAPSKGHSDITTRRMKNRERQRRYRARKRLEVKIRNATVKEETKSVLEPQGNGNGSHSVIRTYCIRDWKKDARRAHVHKCEEMNGSIVTSSTLSSVSEVTCSAEEKKEERNVEREMQSGSAGINHETPRVVLGGRNWKAEARRMRN
ncbi:PREDICTED: uncharacterized protein LOC109333046 isoform X1 [Lupinus angustifolius]|nr:PREDICTED: uncharacterized protein LOC109333046 isoform X1 [Lupinus angustifolius]